MKKQLRIGSVLLCLMMILAMVPGMATTVSAASTASLRVEGIENNLLSLTGLEIGADTTVLDLLTSALKKQNIPYEESDGYISEIAGEADATFGGWDGWVFYINGQEAPSSMKDTVVKNGDEVLVCYSDAYGTPPTLMPQIKAARDANGIVSLTFTATVTTFGADGSMSQSTVPVEAAAVTVDGNAYQTDAFGVVTLDAADSAKSRVTLQIDKKGADGKPLVVRFAPGFALDLAGVTYVKAFTDITPGVWYEEYVYELVALGAIDGYEDGAFRPTKSVTRAEFVKILASVAGVDPTAYKALFTDVAEGVWYAPHITWAADNGIIGTEASLFYPNNNITREDMAVMLARFNANILKKTLPQSNSAPAFTDEDQISAYAAESIYLMQRAGIIEGLGDGRFAPKASAQRSEAAKMIVVLLRME